MTKLFENLCVARLCLMISTRFRFHLLTHHDQHLHAVRVHADHVTQTHDDRVVQPRQ